MHNINISNYANLLKYFNSDFIVRVKENDEMLKNKNMITDERVDISKKKKGINDPFLIKNPNIKPLIHPKLLLKKINECFLCIYL